MDRTTIMLPQDLKSRAARIARLRGISLGELIRSCLDKVVKNPVPLKSSADSFWSDSDFFKGYSPRDMVKNHDTYLYGKEE